MVLKKRTQEKSPKIALKQRKSPEYGASLFGGGEGS
jgi:hypothetical protein